MTEIHIIYGDIFNQNAETLVNPVNCVGVMGAGLAKQFKRKYPAAHKGYLVDCHNGKLEIGHPLVYKEKNKNIVCFPTKNTWQSISRLEYIEAGLPYLQAIGVWSKSIAIPALGCGLGCLHKNNVIPLIVQYMLDSNFEQVFIVLKHSTTIT